MSAVRQAHVDALLMVDSAMLSTNQNRITKLAIQYRLPAISRSPGFAQAGGLFQYEENPRELARRAAVYVDKILKGAKPADLPVEQPMLDQRGRLLVAALGFAGCSMPSYDRALHALRTWLDSWSGIGHVAVGMHRQGYDLQLTQYDERGWRATFYTRPRARRAPGGNARRGTRCSGRRGRH